MQQIANITYFLPCLVSLMWLIIYSFRVKVFTQKVMMAVIMLCVLYFTNYAFYISPDADYQVMCIFDMINVPVVLLLVTVNLVCIYSHHSQALVESRWYLAIYAPVFVFSSVNFFIYYMVGVDGMAKFFAGYDHEGVLPPAYDNLLFQFFVKFHRVLHNVILLTYILVSMGLCFWLSVKNGYRAGDVSRFFFRHNASKPIRVICFLEFVSLCLLVPLAGLGRTYMIQNPMTGSLLSALLCVSLFFLFYVEYMVDLPEFTLSSLTNITIGGELNEVKAPQADAPVNEVPANEEEPDELIPAEAAIVVQPEMISQLRQVFDEEKIYLDPELTLQKLATHLSSNRTTLSAAVSQAYGVNFRQLVAHYRIEAAKRYMHEHPEAKQDLVAIECGFGTAQAFNQKFKEVTGDSPRMWMIKHTT